MADIPMFAPTANGLFDPSQWSNPYSKFAGKALPFPSSYMGWPTDAMGNPIQAPAGMQTGAPAAAAPAPAPTPGTTLTSMPGGYPAGSVGATPAIEGSSWATIRRRRLRCRPSNGQSSSRTTPCATSSSNRCNFNLT